MIKIILAIFSLTLLSCSPTILTKGTSAVVGQTNDGKSLGESWDDTTIKLGIKEKYFSYDATLFTKILTDNEIKKFKYDFEVQKQIIYFFGVSNDQNEINRVIGHAKSIKGVIDIINYIQAR